MPLHVRSPRLASTILAAALIAVSCSNGSDADQAIDGADTAAEQTTTTGADETSTDETSTDDGADETAPPTTDAAAETTEPPAPATTAVLPDGPAPEAPTERGAFDVGRTSIAFSDPERSRRISVDIWYPIDPGTEGEQATYDFISSISVPARDALQDAPVSGDGPFPLVIYSHGSGGTSYIASFFTETLASHGYVVAAPNHLGNTALELVIGSADDPEKIAYNRPLDTSLVITELLEGSDGGPLDFDVALGEAIDPERIGVTGHSFGGFTAVANAGGLDTDRGDIEVDERVDAIALMAPFTNAMPAETLEAVSVPVLAITGTEDATTPIATDTTPALEAARSAYNFQIDLEGGGHQSFTDVCRYQEFVPLIPDVPEQFSDVIDAYAEEGCGAELMPIDRAHELTNRFVISFLNAFVAGDDSYRLLLTDEAVADDTDLTLTIR